MGMLRRRQVQYTPPCTAYSDHLGHTRPMQANPEAMDDLKRILTGRTAFYSKAQFVVNTSAQSLEQTFAQLLSVVRTQVTPL